MTQASGYHARKCRKSATWPESNRRSVVGGGRAHLGPTDGPSPAAPFLAAPFAGQAG
jgi:hypothetical protein